MLKTIELRRTRLAAAMAQSAARGGAAVAAGELEITAVQVYPVREPVSGRTYTVVRLSTRGGVMGFGECGAITPADFAKARAIVVGKPATAYAVAGWQLADLPGIGGAVDIAMLDILGKVTKAPVFQVLGGPTRYKARALAPLSGNTDDDLIAGMKRAMAAGYRAFLAPVPQVKARNQGQAFVVATRNRMQALRKAGGDNVDFVLDGAAALSPGDASTISEALERFHLMWFDEPCPLVSLRPVKKIAAENVTPLGFGRGLTSAAAFQDLVREELVDVLRPDIGRSGITAIRRIAVIGETSYLAVAPFHNGGPIGTVAALHLAASLPNFYIQQIPLPAAEEDRRMRVELTGGTNCEVVQDGFAELLTGPGLGITVNEQALERYRERAA